MGPPLTGVAGVAAGLTRRAGRLGLALALAAVFSAVAYAFTPQTGVAFFGANLRFALPALLFALYALAYAVVDRPTWAYALTGH